LRDVLAEEARSATWIAHDYGAKPDADGSDARCITQETRWKAQPYYRLRGCSQVELTRLKPMWWPRQARPASGQLVVSLAQLGRFPEAVEHEAEAIRLVEPTQNA
jgi:hypothetical protein